MTMHFQTSVVLGASGYLGDQVSRPAQHESFFSIDVICSLSPATLLNFSNRIVVVIEQVTDI